MPRISLFVALLVTSYFPLGYATTALEPLEENEAYVVIPLIVEGHIPDYIRLESTSSFGESYRAKDLVGGESFSVIKLPAGEYQWTRINMHNDRFFDLEDNNFKINVKAGVINYGGHLKVKINYRFSTAQYNYMNRSSVVMDKLKQEYPEIYGSYPLIFAGHSPDPFIAYYQQLVEEGASK